MNLDQLQREAKPWREANFPPEKRTVMHHTLGVAEEAGELAHAVLKMDQNIRGDRDQHLAEAADAAGDLVIYLVGVCDNLGLNFAQCVEQAWNEVKQRNWVEDPAAGRSTR